MCKLYTEGQVGIKRLIDQSFSGCMCELKQFGAWEGLKAIEAALLLFLLAVVEGGHAGFEVSTLSFHA